MHTTSAWILGLLLALPLAASATPPTELPPPGEDFGAPFASFQPPTHIAAILRDPDRFAGQTVMLRGRITDVCQKKGCWTVLAEGDQQIRIRFHDYGFFLPKDSIGVEAWAQGTVSVVTLSEKQARHYEAESRNGDPAAVQGEQREVGFTATGVRLVGRD